MESEGDVMVLPIKERRKVIGHSYSWLIPERDKICVMLCWKDGSITSYIDDMPEDDDDGV